ncbi:hypothetical protein LSTR_LSTR015838 [Laodelphax striatellus]|uniref:Uncharacterized protein n=1 Tax=Laodelphax striatellus TaxID=195883 RepID=A0A482X5W7_LAOST|nr:hypothetical protein LSTR_LSTR015838 [Laodelphax striatellus]
MNDEVEAFKGETSGRGRGACRAPIAEDDRMTTGWMHGSPRLPLLQPKYRHKHTQKGMDGSSSSLIFLESKAALVGGFGAGAFRAPLIIRSPLMNWQQRERNRDGGDDSPLRRRAVRSRPRDPTAANRRPPAPAQRDGGVFTQPLFF